MKSLITPFFMGVIILSTFMGTKVFGQMYGAPVIRLDGGSDTEDLGLLLTVLLLASRNRGSNCGCCCGGNIPIPYPIPIPTNNPIINTYRDCGGSSGGSSGDSGDGGNAKAEPEQNVYIVNSSEADAVNAVETNTGAASASGAASSS